MKLSEVLKQNINSRGELSLDPIPTKLSIEWLESIENRLAMAELQIKATEQIRDESEKILREIEKCFVPIKQGADK